MGVQQRSCTNCKHRAYCTDRIVCERWYPEEEFSPKPKDDKYDLFYG